ncbi:hypothetical protein [Salinimicrobium sp. GXAS 041]|uniref:hypothetical protein n=1 Tax=Salinimicrobium sp. GXAS 041 TaxID=3400806 RepID=UPI003C74CEE7
MKNYFFALCAVLMLASCDDGEIIVTNFQFEENNFEWCSGPDDTQVFFKINNDLSNEAIAVIFELEPFSDDFLLEPLSEDDVFLVEAIDERRIPLNSENEVVYRTFNGDVGDNYFCNEIPPTSPGVLDEYRSTSGGEIVIYSSLNNLLDLDRDGVPTEMENAVIADYYVTIDDVEYPDTDNDGIPNYLDIDDDGDNVSTSEEIAVEAENTASDLPDTDGDGIPNYLDNDDDGDGTLTIFEDWDEDGDPTDDLNDEGVPYYLNPEILQAFDAEPSTSNEITISYRYTVFIEDLTLSRQSDGEQIRLNTYDFGFRDSGTDVIDLFELPEEDGDGEEEEEAEE